MLRDTFTAAVVAGMKAQGYETIEEQPAAFNQAELLLGPFLDTTGADDIAIFVQAMNAELNAAGNDGIAELAAIKVEQALVFSEIRYTTD